MDASMLRKAIADGCVSAQDLAIWAKTATATAK